MQPKHHPLCSGAFIRLFRNTSRVRGFTLIELLVVVAIISLLVSVLMPALSAARAQARTVLCMNSQKALAMAFHSYAEENNGWAPHCVNATWTRTWLNVMTETGFVLTNTHTESQTGTLISCPEMESTGWNNAFGYIRHWQTADVYVRILNDTVGISKAKSSWNNPLPANCVIIGDSRAQSGVQWYALDNNSWGLLSGLACLMNGTAIMS